MKKSIKEIIKNHSDIDRIDVELLLCHVLKCQRVFLLSHSEKILSSEEQNQFSNLISRRKQGEPIAYILGKKAFWNLELIVTPDVLIPRPETELIVEWVLEKFKDKKELVLADLGTGSGAIALSLAKAKPNWKIIATDASEKALSVAKGNAENLKLNNVKFYLGNWCEALPQEKFDVIVSNPPYIEKDDEHLIRGDLRFEPKSALIADDDGFADLKAIVKQARIYLKDSGCLVLEHGYEQAQILREYLNGLGYQNIQTLRDVANHERVTLGNFYS